jgi:hypothetical protein
MKPDTNQDAWVAGDSGNLPPAIIREDQINQALRFLADRRTQGAPLEQKIEFLRNKGLSEQEMNAAFSRYHASIHSEKQQAITQPVYVRPAFMDEPLLWSAIKSIFSAVGSMAIGVLGYHAFLSNTQSESGSTISDPSNSETVVKSIDVGGVSEERLLEAMSELSVKQELRHKELLLSIRELSNSITNTSNARKPGGALVLPAAEGLTFIRGNEMTLPAKSDCEQMSCQDGTAQRAIEEEPLHIETEVHSAIELGIDATLLLILSSPEGNRKLNKSNPRFRKLEGNRLLSYAGYVDTGEFLEISPNRDDKLRRNAQFIIDEIRRARKNRLSDHKSTSRSEPEEGFQSAPWQAGFPSAENKQREEGSREFNELECLGESTKVDPDMTDLGL